MRYVLGFLTVLLVAVSCSGSGSDEPVPVLSVVSFNSGLAKGFVDHADQREPLIGQALARLDADVVCLQEVWTDASVAAIVDAAKETFPHAYSEKTTGEGGGEGAACTTDEVAPLKTCVEANCAGVDPANLATCALGKCGTEFGALPEACSTCIAANIGKAIDEILTTCTTASGPSYAYDGRNGLLLLSRHPLSGTEMKRFDSYLNVRVVLHAVVDTPALGKVDVFCTHLTADLDPDVKYAGTFGSWGAEQAAQVDAMAAWVQEKLGTSDRVAAIVGDLNCGPAKGTTITAAQGPNYQKLRDAAFQTPTPKLADPFVDDLALPCSWCADNPLVRDGKNQILDHVLFLNAPLSLPGGARTVDAARVLDAAVTITVDSKAVETRLSDHYGVQARVLQMPD